MLRESNADQILPNLWLGNALAAKNKDFLVKNDIKYIINISCDIPNYYHGTLNYLNVSINDTDVLFNEISKIFEITNKFIYQAYKNNDAILVHSKRGYNRSAAIVAAFMIKHINMDVDSSIKYINALRRNTFTRETNMTKGLRLYYELIKTK
jgi:protein-tyrosine phosphatase